MLNGKRGNYLFMGPINRTSFFHFTSAIFICNDETAYSFHPFFTHGPVFYSCSVSPLIFLIYLDFFFVPFYLFIYLFVFCFSPCVGFYGYLFVTFFPLHMCVYLYVYVYARAVLMKCWTYIWGQNNENYKIAEEEKQYQ